MRRFASLGLLAALPAAASSPQAAILVGGSAAERAAQRIDPASRCATDLVRRPDGTWWRCGQLESTASELAEAAAAAAEAGAYWP